MSRQKIWQTIIVILLLVNSVVLAFIWFKPGGERPPMPNGDVKTFLVKELELTMQQQKQYEGFRSEHIASIRQLNNDTKDLRDEFFKNISTPVADSALINSLSQKISANEAKKEQITLYHFRKLRSILNEKQQNKFDNIIQDVLKRFGRPPGAGSRPGPPNEGPPPGGRQGQPNGGSLPDDGPNGGPPPGDGPPQNQ